MARIVRTASALGAAGALALAVGNGAAAAPGTAAELGQHVASCAQEHLGQREGAPEVTCSHDGMVMTFATFGAMVEHLRDMHAR